MLCGSQLSELSALENLTKFPHIFEEITSCLPKSGILALTESSKTLNDFISNSSKALKRIMVLFPSIDALKDGRYNFPVVRKYSKWRFDQGIPDEHLEMAAKFLARYAQHIKLIRFDAGKEKEDDAEKEKISKQLLEKILGLVYKNVEVLIVNGIVPRPEAGYGTIKCFTLPKLKKLYLFDGDSLCLAPYLFKMCSLKTLVIMKTHRSSLMNMRLKELLMTQDSLESLNIHCADGLFNNDQMAKMNFKLKKLCIGTFENTFAKPLCAQFMALHRDTLTELRLLYNLYSDLAFEGLPNIKYLELQVCNLHGSRNTWAQVEKLKMSQLIKLSIHVMLPNFENRFQNVTEIELHCFDINYDFLAPKPKVKILKLNCCCLRSNLTCSNLNVLHLNENLANHEIRVTRNFIWNSNNLKELVVKRQKYLPFLCTFLQRDDTNLNLLKVVGKPFMPDVNPVLHRVINENRSKIKDLIVIEKEDPVILPTGTIVVN